MFTFVANKHPGTCAYCAKRVKRGEGSIWKDGGAWLVAHGECLSKAYSAGRGPEVADPSSTAASRLKAVREVMRTVRLDMPQGELERAWDAVCALVLGAEPSALDAQREEYDALLARGCP